MAYRGDRGQFQLTLAYIAGMGDMIGMQAGLDNNGYLNYEYPNRDMYYSTFMLSFSGRIEAAALYAAFKSAYDEEVDRIQDPGHYEKKKETAPVE